MERFGNVGQPMRLTANNYFSPPLACLKLQDLARLDDLRIVPAGVDDPQFPVLFARNGERNRVRDENPGDRELLRMGGWCQNVRKDRLGGTSFCELTPPPMAGLLGGGVGHLGGRGEFDAPKEFLGTAVRRLSRGGVRYA